MLVIIINNEIIKIIIIIVIIGCSTSSRCQPSLATIRVGKGVQDAELYFSDQLLVGIF